RAVLTDLDEPSAARRPVTGEAALRPAPAARTGVPVAAPDGASAAARRRATIERWFLLTVVAGIALENVTTYWATDLIVDRTGAGQGIAAAATAGLVAGMS